MAKPVAHSVFPTSITSRDLEQNEEFSYLNYLCPKFLNQLIRNEFFLPLYKKDVASCLKADQKVAEARMQVFKDLSILCGPQLKVVREFFSVRDVKVHIEGTTFRTFTVRLFESKQPLNEKKLRIILFSFNTNFDATKKGGDERRWNPLTVKELSDGPLSVLRAIGEAGIRVDSVVTMSLGNMLFARATDLVKARRTEVIPRVIMINRGMTSVQKIANQLYSRPLNDILYFIAKFGGWDADPEKELLSFLAKDKEKKREVVVIEAQKDYYFSEKGAFGPDFHQKIISAGAKVFRASFFPCPFQIRSHHALSLEHFEKNEMTEVLADTFPLSLGQEEKVTSMLAREFFYKGDEEFHTCFYVAGNDATLDTGGIRDIIPLAYEFILEGQKLEALNTDQKVS